MDSESKNNFFRNALPFLIAILVSFIIASLLNAPSKRSPPEKTVTIREVFIGDALIAFEPLTLIESTSRGVRVAIRFHLKEYLLQLETEWVGEAADQTTVRFNPAFNLSRPKILLRDTTGKEWELFANHIFFEWRTATKNLQYQNYKKSSWPYPLIRFRPLDRPQKNDAILKQQEPYAGVVCNRESQGEECPPFELHNFMLFMPIEVLEVIDPFRLLKK